MWINLRKKMIPTFWLSATRHEDKLQGGIADVSFVQNKPHDYREECPGMHGWMELKKVSMLPVRPSTIVRIKHYTPEQRSFLLEKGRAGMTFLLLQLERDYLLFDHIRAQAVGTLNTEDTYAAANWVSKNGLDAAGLFEAIDEFG